MAPSAEAGREGVRHLLCLNSFLKWVLCLHPLIPLMLSHKANTTLKDRGYDFPQEVDHASQCVDPGLGAEFTVG